MAERVVTYKRNMIPIPAEDGLINYGVQSGGEGEDPAITGWVSLQRTMNLSRIEPSGWCKSNPISSTHGAEELSGWSLFRSLACILSQTKYCVPRLDFVCTPFCQPMKAPSTQNGRVGGTSSPH